MPVTSNDIANQAVQLVGANQPVIVGVAPNFDDSTAGMALKWLYAPCVAAVARQFEWDFSRKTVALALTGNAAPVPWAFEYRYPPNGVEVWQLMPATIVDPNDPLPFNFVIANAVDAGSQKRVIHANLPNAVAVYNNNPGEDSWDALFRQGVVEFLARCLALAIEGKPDAAQALLSSGAAFSGIGQTRQG